MEYKTTLFLNTVRQSEIDVIMRYPEIPIDSGMSLYHLLSFYSFVSFEFNYYGIDDENYRINTYMYTSNK